jgi:hypothetical protein
MCDEERVTTLMMKCKLWANCIGGDPFGRGQVVEATPPLTQFELFPCSLFMYRLVRPVRVYRCTTASLYLRKEQSEP